MTFDCKLHVLATNLSSLYVVQSVVSMHVFTLLCTGSNEQLCVEPRLYHYRWSWVCQAFSDYQMQQMTSNFIEQFGFNDEEFADQDDVVE